MLLWSVHSPFHWCMNYKNRPRYARVIVENKCFFMEHGVYGSVKFYIKTEFKTKDVYYTVMKAHYIVKALRYLLSG